MKRLIPKRLFDAFVVDAPSSGAEVQKRCPSEHDLNGYGISGLLIGERVRKLIAEIGPPPIALAFSGGGFRATLAAIGVLRFLAATNLLERVIWVSSVSGGSVAAAAFAKAYNYIEQNQFSLESVDYAVTRPLVQAISSRSFAVSLLKNSWRVFSRTGGRTGVLAYSMDDWFFEGMRMADVSDRCHFEINTTNLVTGKRFGISQHWVGDEILGHVKTSATNIRIAEAVAASAAVPGVFSAYSFRFVDFPCGKGNMIQLVDGGVWDNLGMDSLPQRPSSWTRFVMNAGGIFRPGPLGWLPVVRELSRSTSVMYTSTVASRLLRHRAEVASLAEPPTQCTDPKFLSAMNLNIDPFRRILEESEDTNVAELALLPTSFAKFSGELCKRLICRGWWLTGNCLYWPMAQKQIRFEPTEWLDYE